MVRRQTGKIKAKASREKYSQTAKGKAKAKAAVAKYRGKAAGPVSDG